MRVRSAHPSLLDTELRRDLFDSIADNNEDFEEDYVDIDEAERIENHREDLLDNYGNWLGELTSAQTDLIETSAAELRSSARERLERRRRWQEGIREILDSGETRSQKTLELRRFFANFDAHEDVEMEAIERSNSDLMDRLTVQLAQLMTQNQAITSLRKRMNIFESLPNWRANDAARHGADLPAGKPISIGSWWRRWESNPIHANQLTG